MVQESDPQPILDPTPHLILDPAPHLVFRFLTTHALFTLWSGHSGAVRSKQFPYIEEETGGHRSQQRRFAILIALPAADPFVKKFPNIAELPQGHVRRWIQATFLIHVVLVLLFVGTRLNFSDHAKQLYETLLSNSGILT